MKEIRLGTIGSGEIVRNILDGVSRTDGISLEAVYSRDEEKGRALAALYGAEKVYTELDAMFSDEAINFIYVASPNILHYPQTRQALLAGKNVICEKPFCTKASQARELVALAKEKGLILVEAVPTTYLPNFVPLKEALSKIGQPHLVLGNYSQYSSRYDKLLAGEVTNVFNPDYAGGALMDINYYNIYLTLALFGKPISAFYRANLHDNGIDTSGIAILGYPGFAVSLAGSKDARGESFYQIEGEKGCIYIKDGPNGLVELRVVTTDGEETINLQPDPSRWYYEIQNLTPILLAEDHAAIDERMKLMINVVELIEKLRQWAGIRFPGDD